MHIERQFSSGGGIFFDIIDAISMIMKGNIALTGGISTRNHKFLSLNINDKQNIR